MTIPISIASNYGSLRTGTKSIIADIITEDVVCPTNINVGTNSCLVIDGQTMIFALGKPAETMTSGDLADVFVQNAIVSSKFYSRIDVTYDRYMDNSIKAGTCKNQSKKSRPIRKVVDDRAVPLPQNWNDFLAVPANKKDLALLLSTELIANALGTMIVRPLQFSSSCRIIKSLKRIKIATIKIFILIKYFRHSFALFKISDSK